MIAEGKGGGAGTTKREVSWQGEGSRGELKGEVRMRLKSESGEREGGRGYRGRRKRERRRERKRGVHTTCNLALKQLPLFCNA